MTLIGTEKAMKKVVNAIPQVLPSMPESFPKDIGHFSDYNQKKEVFVDQRR